MAFESLLSHSYSRSRAVTFGAAYDEPTFRHLFGLERRRAADAGRPLLLVLVSLKRAPETTVRMSSSVAARVFDGLARAVREVDFIGWYRQGRVAGAVLVQGEGGSGAAARQRAGERIGEEVRARLPGAVSAQLRVRVVQVQRQHGD